MITQRRSRLAVSLMAVALALTVAVVAGCSTSLTAPKSGPTALGSLPVAVSSLSTAAPDARLLIVQTVQAVEATATPVWAFLFGSPSTDKTYVVYVTDGASMSGAQEYGTAGLSADEWAKVPGTEAWTIDSDTAYEKALAVSGAKGTPTGYMMGFLTYKPAADTSTVEAYVWNVQFDPGDSGATTSTIRVDAKSGAASVTK